jgi:hypothetical protein
VSILFLKRTSTAVKDLKIPETATLACGCQLSFRDGVAGSPVLVVVERKAPGCGVALHVSGVPVYDHRSALRPPTRFGPPLQPDFEDG